MGNEIGEFEGHVFWTPARRTALKPLAAVLNSVLTLVSLVLATRAGLFADIAAYTAGASVGALVSALAGSGTSLAYITGDRCTRAAVRRLRYRFVAPGMVLGVGVAGLVYAVSTDLLLEAVVAGGVAVALNNLAELESAALERRLLTHLILAATSFSRVIGVVVLLVGGAFSVGMLVTAVLGFALLKVFSVRRIAPDVVKVSIRDSFRLAYTPSLVTLSLLDIVITRAVLLIVPFVLSVEEAGALSALISAQQSAAAVLASTLYTVLAARSAQGSLKGWMTRVSSVTVWFAAAISLGGALGAPVVVLLLSLQSVPDAGLWWALLALSILPITANRGAQYSLLAVGNRRDALLLLTLIAGTVVTCCGAASATGQAVVLAGASLCAEGLGVLQRLCRKVFGRRDGWAAGEVPTGHS